MILKPILNQITIIFLYSFKGTLYFKFVNDIFIWVDILVYSGVPFIVMSICSIIIIKNIRKSSQGYFKNLVKNKSILTLSIHYKRLKRDRQLLYLLLLTNLLFILSSAPFCISFLLFRGDEGENGLGQLTVHVLAYSNNAFNFLLYGISSQKYRQEFFWFMETAKKKYLRLL